MAVSVRRLAAAMVVCLLAATVAGVTLGATGSTGDTDTPVVSVGDVSVESGATASVPVSLSSAPSGLSGYTLVVEVSNPDVATLESATVASAFGMTNVTSIDDGYRLKAADVDSAVESGASDVRLATLTVRGADGGRTDVAVSVEQVDDDGGDRVAPETDDGRITVESDAPENGRETSPSRTSDADPTTVQTSTPTDPTTTDATVPTTATTTPTPTTTTTTATTHATPTTTSTETTAADSAENPGTDGFGPVVTLAALVATLAVAARRD